MSSTANELDDLSLHYAWTSRERERVQQYAKQQSIAFERWKLNEGWLPEENSLVYRSINHNSELTIEDLYKEFKQQTNQ